MDVLCVLVNKTVRDSGKRYFIEIVTCFSQMGVMYLHGVLFQLHACVL